MGLLALSVRYQLHSLAGVAAVQPRVAAITEAIRPHCDGIAVVSTCNRIEWYCDTGAPEDVTAEVAPIIAETDAKPAEALTGMDAVRHLFAVASGLDSRLVGEREISGQVRRALTEAREQGLASHLLTECFERALATSRKVAAETNLMAAGRSLANVGVRLALAAQPGNPEKSPKTLLIGTGALAASAGSALAAADIADVTVYSNAGRAATIADRFGWSVTDELAPAVVATELIVCCHGASAPLIGVDVLGAGQQVTVLDLSLPADSDPAIADLPGVQRFDLARVLEAVPAADGLQVDRARELVSAGVKDLAGRLRGRSMDSAIVAIRAWLAEVVADVSGGSEQDAEIARKVVAKLAHRPSILARRAAREGRADEFLRAVSTVTGVELKRDDRFDWVTD